VAAGFERALLATFSEVRAQRIQREANYFRTNASRVDYPRCQQEQLPLASGVVEAGCKQFKIRFGRAVMRWSGHEPTNLMPIRASVMGHRYDRLFVPQ
jgi:hypothetical protein